MISSVSLSGCLGCVCYSVFYNGGVNSCESVRGRVWEGLMRRMTVHSVKCVVVCAWPTLHFFFLYIQPDYGPTCHLIVGRATDWSYVTVDTSWHRKRERQYSVI